MSNLSDTIFELIITGEYGPGEKLIEAELAGRLGVSRTPIREALMALSNTGVVVVEKNKGARVSDHSEESVEAAYAARSVLEPYAARLAMDHMSDLDLAALRSVAEEMHTRSVESPNLADIAVLNNKFHMAILARCPNRRVAEISMGMLKPLVASRTFHSYTSNELTRSALHHLEIVDALTHKDPEWVESIMRSHIRAGYHSALSGDSRLVTNAKAPQMQ